MLTILPRKPRLRRRRNGAGGRHGRLAAGAAACCLAAATGLVGVGANPASAAGNCYNGNEGVYGAGYQTVFASPTLNYGSQANIVTQNTAICQPTYYGNDSSEWVMLADATMTQSHSGYAQAGYLNGPTYYQPYYFVEYNLTGNTADDHQYIDLSGPAVGSKHLYTVQYIASQSQEIMGFDFTSLGTMPNPFNYWGKRYNQYDAEVHNSETDIAGTSGAKVNYSSLAVQQPFHNCCDVVNQNLYAVHGLSKFHVDTLAYAQFNSWD